MAEVTKDEQVRVRMQALGIDRVTAEFIVGIEAGEIYSDVIELGANGEELRPDRWDLSWLEATT